MAILTNTGSAIMIVPELLERGNYKSWSIFMEDYLISQELWDGIIVPFVFSVDHPLLSESEWRKRNATALNAIKISCGPKSFVLVKYTRSAREALDMLAEMHKTEHEIDKSTPQMNVAITSTIVPELLERGNYERWSIFMKNYLVSQDLWVVTQCWLRPLKVSKREWRKKNAAALHAIQISCGAEKFNHIKKIYLAIKAWDELKRINIEEKSKIDNSEHEEKEDDDDDEEEEETPKINSPNMIVPELLASDNYKRWSICMKSYLVSQDLWDAVLYSRAPAGVDRKEWIKKDAAALHAIQISCRPKKFDEIEKITSAKTAWDTLKQKHIEKHPEDGPPPDWLDFMAKQGFRTMERTKSLFVQNAIDKGDVDAVMDFFKRNPGAGELRFWTGDTSLHYSARVGKLNIVKALLESTPAVQKDAWNNTALSNAAQYGNTEIAKYLVSKDSTLLYMEDDEEEIPVVTACGEGHKEVTYFLYSETPFEILLRENGKQGSKLLLDCFNSETFDIMFHALHHDQQHGHILIDKNWKDLLNLFAGTPTAFISGSGLTFWQRWIYECLRVHMPSDFAIVTINLEEKNFEEIPLPGRLWRLASILLPFLGIKQIHALMLSHVYASASLRLICKHLTKLNWTKLEDTTAPRRALTRAIENGIYDFLVEMVETNVDLLFAPRPADDETTTVNFLMDAIAFRQDKIAHVLFGLPIGQVYISTYPQGNSVLHMAGKLASDSQLSHISSAALQMQREIQWFKEVESIVPHCVKNAKNKNGETAYQVLAREHKDLLKKAEDWMKELAGSYIIVGTLIVTIMFATAFTLPGGNNQIDGFPIFKNKVAFMIYIIFDAISLFAAAASVIIFLGFLTSRYNMEDFHKSIPRKLMAGVSTLFISLAAMMIAFCSAIFLMLENRWWIIIPSVLFAGIPVSLFARLQLPLLLEIYVLTYKSPIFSEEKCLASKIKAFFLGKKKIE